MSTAGCCGPQPQKARLLAWLVVVAAAASAASVGAAADRTAVGTLPALRQALTDPSVGSVQLIGNVVVSSGAWPDPVLLTRGLTIVGTPEVILDLGGLAGGLVTVGQGGALEVSNLTIANFSSSPLSSSATGPIPAIATTNSGSVAFSNVLLYETGSRQALLGQPWWQGQQAAGNGLVPVQGRGSVRTTTGTPQAWAIPELVSPSVTMRKCKLVEDPDRCLAASSSSPAAATGPIMVYDSVSLLAALTRPGPQAVLVLQNITLEPAVCTVTAPRRINSSKSLYMCPRASLNLNQLHPCVVVTTGGVLDLAGGTYIGSKAMVRQQWPTNNPLFLSAVNIEGSGQVQVRDAAVFMNQPLDLRTLFASYPTAVRPLYELKGDSWVRVAFWNVTRAVFAEHLEAAQAGTWQGSVAGLASASGSRSSSSSTDDDGDSSSSSGATGGSSSDRSLLGASTALGGGRSSNSIQMQQQQQQQQPGAVQRHHRRLLWPRASFGAGHALQQVVPGRVPGWQQPTPHTSGTGRSDGVGCSHGQHGLVQRAAALAAGPATRQLQQAMLVDLSPSATWSFRNVTLAQEQPGRSCFSDYPGSPAATAEELQALLRDPNVTRVELTSNIVLTEDLFPPPLPGQPCRGANITSQVEVRACSKHAARPIIVDMAGLGPAICVSGYLRFQGTIKFTNSAPLPERAGLWPLLSVLTTEANGVIEFEDVIIAASSASPLHSREAAFWSSYGQMQELVPQAGDYFNISAQDIFLVDWQVYTGPWAAALQGANAPGTTSTGYWSFLDSLITWDPTLARGPGASGAPSPTPGQIVAVALPAAFCAVVLLVTCTACSWWYLRRRKKRRRLLAAASLKAAADGDSATGEGWQCGEGGRDADAGGGGGAGAHFNRFSSDGRSGGGGSGAVAAAAAAAAAGAACSGGDAGVRSSGSGGRASRQVSLGRASLASTGSRERPPRTEDRIEAARREMHQRAAGGRLEDIALEELLGEGTFGKVFKGVWRGTQVAVKAMVFPANMSGKEKREKMAIMETAISSSLSHPNVVQTYTYAVRPVRGEISLQQQGLPSQGAGAASPPDSASGNSPFWADEAAADVHSWEVQLVLEYCDLGTLRDALNRGLFALPDGGRDYAGVLATAADIAQAMLHLHHEAILHSDLKARNVLLKSGSGGGKGYIAKVADFGLSIKLDTHETHVSNLYQGTMTHMAPEVLMYGKISSCSDVYAFGILLWELYTGALAFKGVPKALLGHEITQKHLRPALPEGCPEDYAALTQRCWADEPADRPSFGAILAELQRLQQQLQAALAAQQLVAPPDTTLSALRWAPEVVAPPGGAAPVMVWLPSMLQPLAGLPPDAGRDPRPPPCTPANTMEVTAVQQSSLAGAAGGAAGATAASHLAAYDKAEQQQQQQGQHHAEVELVIQQPQHNHQPPLPQQQQGEGQEGGVNGVGAGAPAAATAPRPIPPPSGHPSSQQHHMLGSSPAAAAGVVGSAPVLRTALVHLPPASAAAADTNAPARLSMVSFSVSRRSLVVPPLAPGAAVSAPGAVVHILGHPSHKAAGNGRGGGDEVGSAGPKSVYLEEHTSTMVGMLHSQQQGGSSSDHHSSSHQQQQHQQQQRSQGSAESAQQGCPQPGSSSGVGLGHMSGMTSGDVSPEWQSPREHSTTAS